MNQIKKLEKVVYFAAGREHIKIGFTANLRTRFQALQTASAEDLTLLGAVPGNSAMERAIHRRLAEFRHRGEWFVDCEPVRSAVNEICGKDVFGLRAVSALPPARRGRVRHPTPEEINLQMLDEVRGRMQKFLEFFVGPETQGSSSPMTALPLARKHLAVAAMKYAQAGYEEQRAAFLYDDMEEDEGNTAFKRALAFAEQLECHIEMICGSDFKEILTGWPRKPRLNPAFETNF